MCGQTAPWESGQSHGPRLCCPRWWNKDKCEREPPCEEREMESTHKGQNICIIVEREGYGLKDVLWPNILLWPCLRLLPRPVCLCSSFTLYTSTNALCGSNLSIWLPFTPLFYMEVATHSNSCWYTDLMRMCKEEKSQVSAIEVPKEHVVRG